MIDPHGDGAPEAFRAGETSADPDTARSMILVAWEGLSVMLREFDAKLQRATALVRGHAS
jgi:hypothetical protein